MSKQVGSSGGGGGHSSTSPPPASGKGSWANALYKYVDEPEKYRDSVIVLNDDLVVIKDGFPKATYHFLVLPRKNRVLRIQAVTRAELPLLRDMKKCAEEVVQQFLAENPKLQFRCGFHALPSMNLLHLHVISQDFVAETLKKKAHWNSFTTDFFKDIDQVIALIEKEGRVHFDEQEYEALLELPLACHLCIKARGESPQFLFKTMPKLKEHLATTHALSSSSL